MKLRTAVILAAGMGTRLGERGRQLPKGFLQLGERPIVEESLLRLQRVGITRILIVTGHLSRFYAELQQGYGGLVQTVHNPEFADSGSMYSLYLLRNHLDEDFLLLESDLIYEQRALDTLQAAKQDNAVLLSGFTDSGDEVFVETRAGLLVDMSKQRSRLGAPASGELVGISRISQPLFALMVDYAGAAFRKTLHLDYETDCLVGVSRDTAIHCPVVGDLLWSEIDDAAHLARAQETIYPKIRDLDVRAENSRSRSGRDSMLRRTP
jgi:2-aminoethylphosphonate-pyruvate transaminase